MDKVICKDVYGKEYSVNIEDLQQRVGVYAIVIRDDKILLTRQWGGYGIVGGGVDNGETLQQALVREVQEETGLLVAPGKLFHHVTTFYKKDADATPYQSLQLYFQCHYESGEVHSDDITGSEYSYTNGVPEWVNMSDVDKVDFYHSIPLQDIINVMDAK